MYVFYLRSSKSSREVLNFQLLRVGTLSPFWTMDQEEQDAFSFGGEGQGLDGIDESAEEEEEAMRVLAVRPRQLDS